MHKNKKNEGPLRAKALRGGYYNGGIPLSGDSVHKLNLKNECISRVALWATCKTPVFRVGPVERPVKRQFFK